MENPTKLSTFDVPPLSRTRPLGKTLARDDEDAPAPRFIAADVLTRASVAPRPGVGAPFAVQDCVKTDGATHRIPGEAAHARRHAFLFGPGAKSSSTASLPRAMKSRAYSAESKGS